MLPAQGAVDVSYLLVKSMQGRLKTYGFRLLVTSVFIAVSICVLFLFGPKYPRLPNSPESTSLKSPSARQDCPTEVENDIQLISSVSEAVAQGEAHLNRMAQYNLACARRAYLKAIDIDARGSLVVWHQLGRIDFLEGQFEDAILKFERQIEYFGDTLPNVHYMLGLTYGYKARRDNLSGDWERAEGSFRRYIELDPMSPWARVDLAWVLFSQGKYQEMKSYLEEGLLAHPRNAWLLNMYGLALLNTEDREGAYLYFKAARQEAEKLTTADWGAAYPGNDPASWEKGLNEMRAAIEKNYALVAGEFAR